MTADKPDITVIMHAKERVKDHVIDPTFALGNASLPRFVSWDEMQNWVGEGHDLRIRLPAQTDKPSITIVMHVKARNGAVLQTVFRREGTSFHRHVSWDDIHTWVADGHAVTIRPPVVNEHYEFLRENAKYPD